MMEFQVLNKPCENTRELVGYLTAVAASYWDVATNRYCIQIKYNCLI
jgi:hypothetical protein